VVNIRFWKEGQKRLRSLEAPPLKKQLDPSEGRARRL